MLERVAVGRSSRRNCCSVSSCGVTLSVPGGCLVVCYPHFLATKVINSWSLRDLQILGYVYVCS